MGKKVLLKELFDNAKKKQKISRSPSNKERVKERDTGFFRTRKVYCQSCKKKFTYRYKYFDMNKEKNRVITCVNLPDLKRKVQKKGLEWKVDKYYEARKTAKEVGLPLRDLK